MYKYKVKYEHKNNKGEWQIKESILSYAQLRKVKALSAFRNIEILEKIKQPKKTIKHIQMWDFELLDGVIENVFIGEEKVSIGMLEEIIEIVEEIRKTNE